MKIEFDTKELNSVDVEVMQQIVNHFGKDKKEDPHQVKYQIFHKGGSLGTVRPSEHYTGVEHHKTGEERILDLLKNGSLTNIEISMILKIPLASVHAYVSKLYREKKIDKTTTRPLKYFLRSKGNDELQDALRNAKNIKVSNF